MLLSPRKNGPDSLFKEVRVFKKLAAWRVPNPPGANNLVAERACPTRRVTIGVPQGLPGVPKKMRQESLGISNRLLTPLSHKTAKTSKGPFQLPGGLAPGVLGTRQDSNHRDFSCAF